MAVAIEGSTEIAHGGSYTASTTGSNRLVVLIVHQYPSASGITVSSVSMGAQAATKIVESSAASVRGTTSLWYILDASIPTGAQTITVTPSTGTTDGRVHCFTLSDVDQTTPSDGNTSNVSTGLGATVQHSGLSNSNNGMALGGSACHSLTNRSWSPPSTPDVWTEDHDNGANGLSGCSAHWASDGTNSSGTWTMDASRNAVRTVAVAAFAPSATTAYTLPADSGSYTLTGSAAALTITRKLIAASGNYSITGSSVDFTYSGAEPENATDSGNPREHTYYAHWEALRLAVYAYYGIDPDKH